jgi:hypothetical protein
VNEMSLSRRGHQPKTDIDAEEALRHLRLLRHDGHGVTQIEVFRRNEVEHEPQHFTGIFSPARYDDLVAALESLCVDYPAACFKIYVRTNPFLESVLRYADHKFSSAMQVGNLGLVPGWPGPTLIACRTNFLFDIDSRASDKDTPTTEEQKASPRPGCPVRFWEQRLPPCIRPAG